MNRLAAPPWHSAVQDAVGMGVVGTWGMGCGGSGYWGTGCPGTVIPCFTVYYCVNPCITPVIVVKL